MAWRFYLCSVRHVTLVHLFHREEQIIPADHCFLYFSMTTKHNSIPFYTWLPADCMGNGAKYCMSFGILQYGIAQHGLSTIKLIHCLWLGDWMMDCMCFSIIWENINIIMIGLKSMLFSVFSMWPSCAENDYSQSLKKFLIANFQIQHRAYLIPKYFICGDVTFIKFWQKLKVGLL